MRKMYKLLLMLFSITTFLKAQTTVTLYPTNATNHTGSVTSAGAFTTPLLSALTSGGNRGFVRFDLSSIPAGATFTAATMKLTTATGTANSTSTLNQIRVVSIDPVSTSGATLYGGLSTTSGVQAWIGAWANATIPTTFPMIFLAGGLTELGNIRLSQNFVTIAVIRGSTNSYNFSGSDAATGVKPELTVTYTIPPPCSGTPTGGTTVATPTAACPGANVAISVTGSTTGATGLTFQWQSSPDNIAPYTDIAGAVGTTLNTTITSSKYFRRKITCSGLDAFSTPVQVTFSGPSFVAIPYTEGFEAVWGTNSCSGTNALPNATYWSATPTTGNNAWRRDGDFTSAAWSFVGDEPAPFPDTANVGDYCARFHSYGSAAGLVGSMSVYLNCSSASGLLEVSFDHVNKTGTDILKVMLSTDGGQTFSQLGANVTTNTSWTKVTRTFTTTSATVVIKLDATSDFGNDDIGVDDFQVKLAPSCLAPSGLTVSSIAAPTATISWSAVATASSYDYGVNTVNTPPVTFTNTMSLTGSLSGLVVNTNYYAFVRSICAGSPGPWTQVAFNTTPNDDCAGAINIPVTPSGNTCTPVNFTTVSTTQSPDAAPTCASFGYEDDVWYKFTADGTNAKLKLSGFTVVTGASTGLGVQLYSGTCATLAPISCAEIVQPGTNDSLNLTGLTAGQVYTLRIWGNGAATNAVSGGLCIFGAVPPPSCTTNLTPANAATGVTSVATGVPLTWNAAPGADSYDLYFGTTNPPTINIGNTTATTANVTGILYSTTYYWYVVPRNGGGAATGCNTSTTSFTTELAPNNCVPLYSTGCTGGDKIDLLRLKGESTELYINTAAVACATPAYIDSTDHPTIIDLSRGKSYWGQAQCGFSNNYISAWIDGNDNGQFENSERIISNLLVGTTLTNLNFFVPLSTPLGNHRLRVRNVYYGTAPTAPTDPCISYTYGETEDYTVNIIAGGTPYTIASYTPVSATACYDGIGKMTVDPASLSGVSYIPIVDSLNSLVAQIYPNGNNLGTVSANYFINTTGTVRQTETAQFYLDRNYTISVTTPPTTTYNLRLPYKNTELNALIAQPGSGVVDQFSLVMTKTTSNVCSPQFISASPVLYFPTGFGTISGDRFVDITNITGFSSFFLHGGSTPLPVTLTNVRGEITGATNTVSWITATESNNRKFVVERSLNGSSFAPIGEVATRATGGNSSVALNYNFVDANPVQGKQYYRLQMVDNGGRTTYSQIVTLRRGGGKLEIVDVRPNPTTGNLYFNLLGVNNNSQFTLTLRTIEGKAVLVKNNFIPLGAGVIDMSSLANGLYILEATDVRTSEKALFKVVKQ
jgi:hypothetical protein